MGTLLDSGQVMGRLNISQSTLSRLLKRKEIKGFKVGRDWRFEEADLQDYIKRQRAKREAE